MTGLAIYLAYRFAATVARLLGETGLDVLVRLSAFILICIGIEILWSDYQMLTTANWSSASDDKDRVHAPPCVDLFLPLLQRVIRRRPGFH